MIETSCILGRAPLTKETLPDFREWCRVTRHPRVFHELTGFHRDTPGFGESQLGITAKVNHLGSSVGVELGIRYT